VGGTGDEAATLSTCAEANAGLRRTTALPAHDCSIRDGSSKCKFLLRKGLRISADSDERARTMQVATKLPIS